MRSSIRMICGININNRSILFTRKNLIYIYKTKNMIKFSENNLSSTFLRSLVKDQLLEQYLNIQSQMSGETIINTNRHSHFTSMMCTHSQHDSNHDSRQASISRKMSASMSKKQLDMDKLIGDVKITPAKNNKYSQCITNIRHQLQGLKDLPQILDQVKTIQLLLNSLSKKVQLEGQGSVSNASHQRSSSKLSHQRLGSISPIKQFEDINSHIVYTNFSIKGIGNGNGNWQDGQSTRRSVAEIQQLQTPIKRALFDESQNNEIERINSEIKVLEKILQSKGINQRISQRQHLGTHDTNSKDNIRTSGNKAKYMQSENLCPLFRKNTHQSSQQKNGFILLQGKNNKIPGANLR